MFRSLYSFNRCFSAVSSKSKIIFSGIQPSGIPHIGNYFGAIKNWVQMQQDALPEDQVYFGIMSYHALTTQNNPKILHENILKGYCSLLASGLKPTDNSILFIQSDIPEHCELMWILSNLSKLGKLSRMTQYKDKSKSLQKDDIHLGLLAYPVLMAADIMLYNTTHVPVGEDQIQHVELCRDLVLLFNKQYQTSIPLPIYVLPEKNEKRIMSLINGSEKMSKSAPSEYSRILITDTPDHIQKTIKKAKSDSLPYITNDENRLEVRNLLTILSSATNKSIDQVYEEWNGKTMSQLKPVLSEALIECLKPIRENYELMMKDPESIRQLMMKEQSRIHEIASRNMKSIKEAVGLSF
ncbi:hypothetical protein WA158_006261 [Blastocystis sp. Blastoise]